ncbi:MAG: BON domain-containing protein [Blastocatellia bacterium]|nr:BON domain-containing protein [Blastocatellia bacterium]
MRILFALVIISMASLNFGCGQPEPSRNANDNANADAKSDGGASDTWITSRTLLALIGDERTSGFETEVETKGGGVTLKGKVDSEEAKATAAEIARNVAGVKSVDNLLQVTTEAGREAANVSDDKITDAIEKAIDSNESLQGISLMALSNQGMITLNGTVDTQEQLLAFAQAIRKIAGVKAVVTNEVTIRDEKK